MVSLASTDPMGWPIATEESDEALGLADTWPPAPSSKRGSLDRVLGVEGPMGEARALGIALQIAEVLAAAHVGGIVHGALAPAKVLVTSSGGREEVEVVGWLGRRGFDATGTCADSRLGVLRYMSPEQWHGGAVGPWSDVYTFGVVLYELLTGQLPVGGRSMVEIARSILRAGVPPMRVLRPEVSPALDAIVFRCLDKNPWRRPTTAALVGVLRASAPSARARPGPLAACA